MAKKIVNIQLNISNITEINTIDEILEAEVGIISDWKIPKKEALGPTEHINKPRPLYNYDDTNYKKIKKNTWEQEIWNPKLYITNLIKKYHY